MGIPFFDLKVQCQSIRTTDCSDIKQNIEVVAPDYRYLFSFDKKDDLSTKLRLALEEKEIVALKGKLYARCATKYSWDTIAGQYEKLFRSVLVNVS